MPELPEVETTRRGITPHILDREITELIVREPRLRWPVPADLPGRIAGQRITAVERRAKYLLLSVAGGTVLMHLGMSGSLRIVGNDVPLQKHDHVDFLLADGRALRFHDPRKFGCLLWLEGDPLAHPLLCNLGPEPLSAAFTGEALYTLSRKRSIAIKNFIMDSHVVVGVGNIYANEALYRSGIRPTREAGRVSRARFDRLARAIRDILQQAIDVGGTTLRDFLGGDGQPGYFKQSLAVYGRGGLPCLQCGSILKEVRLGQRTTVYCAKCQR